MASRNIITPFGVLSQKVADDQPTTIGHLNSAGTAWVTDTVNPGTQNPASTNANDNGSGGGRETPQRSLVDIVQRRQTGGVLQRVKVFSDGSEEVMDTSVDKSAGESAAEMFRAAGLGEDFVNGLMGVINGVYAANVDPTQGQILNSIYNSEPYKKRFSANEVIRKRIADGKGMPGDRLLSPKEYIDAENSYRTVLQDADMPTGFYDSQDDFTNLISNTVSVSEFKSRVETAADALHYADQGTVAALKDYYGLSTGDLTAYLLDPSRAMPVLDGKVKAQSTNMTQGNSRTDLQRMYAASQVGGMAARQGMASDQALSEEIVNTGNASKAESAFAGAAADNQDLQRLGSLYGEPLDFKDMVKETLNLSGGIDAGRKRKRLASQERAQFGTQGAIDRSSLSRMTDV